jgi:transcriptional regulator with XRE-family HTH domain
MYSDFKDRFLYVLSECKCSKSSAAEKLHVSAAFISQLCSGVRTPSERTLTDICDAFNVDPTWLRTGAGDNPFLPVSREQKITDILSKAISGHSSARDRLIRALARLPDEAFPLIEQYILEAAESIQSEKKE